jgi:hypothetical protein
MSLDKLAQNPGEFQLPAQPAGIEHAENEALSWSQERVDQEFDGMAANLAQDALDHAQPAHTYRTTAATPEVQVLPSEEVIRYESDMAAFEEAWGNSGFWSGIRDDELANQG